MEMWAGFECSIVRVRDGYRNQIKETGHYDRCFDFARMAELGMRKIRFPVLWELTGAAGPCNYDWHWTDSRLECVRSLGMEPIAGLLHHGSGPRYTNLLDPRFPLLFAEYAASVAERYPWICDYTPINEPNTTARFSCLYGHWYPHAVSTPEFFRAMLNQMRATVLAMKAIRRMVPGARLVQTEDFGFILSTPALAYQADYENSRRWLGFDLLCGRVDRHHPLFAHLIQNGIEERELAEFRDNPCPPDIIGVNHYLTSHRFLDEALDGYPEESWGGNGIQSYADVAAVRVDCGVRPGPEDCIVDAWSRYGIPLAVTEVHNGADREEQVRWLVHVWNAAHSARRRGADVKAVTAWAAAGCYDWHVLLTRSDDRYECGLLDAREKAPRFTVLASAVSSLTRNSSFDHPLLDDPGWWQRPDRLHISPELCHGPKGKRRLMIIGKRGTLGQALARTCLDRFLSHVLVGREDMDIADSTQVMTCLERERPWAVINAAGFVRVWEAADRRDECMRVNVTGAEALASACARIGIPFATFSSDLVFDGRDDRPKVESDPVSPLCVYGESKALAEQKVLSALPEALVVRTSAFFGPWDRYNFLYIALKEISEGRTFHASDDVRISPTFVPDLANVTLDLLLDQAYGIWHVANAGCVSWYDFLTSGARAVGADPGLILRSPAGARFTALASERGLCVPTLDHAIARFAKAWTALR